MMSSVNKNHAILIVDDNVTILNLYRMLLNSFGFSRVDVAVNGKEALEKYKKALYDYSVILMDYRMPIMNGIDAMLKILRRDKNVKIIFNSADTSIKAKALKCGAIDFIEKPADLTVLMEKISSSIKSSLEELPLLKPYSKY